MLAYQQRHGRKQQQRKEIGHTRYRVASGQILAQALSLKPHHRQLGTQHHQQGRQASANTLHHRHQPKSLHQPTGHQKTGQHHQRQFNQLCPALPKSGHQEGNADHGQGEAGGKDQDEVYESGFYKSHLDNRLRIMLCFNALAWRRTGAPA